MAQRYLRTIEQIESLKQLNSIEFYARQIVDGFLTGIHRSPYHGFSVEFAEHRNYNVGESTRFIDWKLYGRTDKLYVKKFEAETNLRCQLVIDCSSSMLYPPEKRVTKLGFAALCSAALTHLLMKQRDSVGITTFTNRIETHLPTRLSAGHQKNVFARLDELLARRYKEESREEPPSATALAPVLHQVSEMLPKRSLVVLFSDIFSDEPSDEIFHAFEHLRYNHHEVIVFQVTHNRTEMEFEFENRPFKVVDMESGDVLKLNPSEIKSYFRKLSREHQEHLRARFLQYKIDYIEADIDRPFDQVLSPWLLKRSRMF